MIKVITWKWQRSGYRDTYTSEHVNTFYRMMRRHSTVPFEALCITDDPVGIDSSINTMKLWDNPAPAYGGLHRPNCFVRLKAFSSEMVPLLGRFIWFDLDCTLVGNVDHLLNDTADFKIWRPDHEKMPCNGSLVLHQAGTRPYTWAFFDKALIHPQHGFKYTTGFVGSDQAWIAYNLKPYDQFFEQKEGVYSYRCHLLERDKIPSNASVVFFNGERKPWHCMHLPWVKENYV